MLRARRLHRFGRLVLLAALRFGADVAFIACTFWLVEALAAIGDMDEAQQVMTQVHAARSPVGLLSEHYEAGSGRSWGNFPRAYSHAGLIHAAFAASPRWPDVM